MFLFEKRMKNRFGLTIYGVKIVGLKYPTTFQTGNFRNWINKSSVPFPAISVYQRGDWTCVSATALEKKSSLKIGIWGKPRLEYYSKKSNFISDRHQYSEKEPNFHWSCFWNFPFERSKDISTYQWVKSTYCSFVKNG